MSRRLRPAALSDLGTCFNSLACPPEPLDDLADFLEPLPLQPPGPVVDLDLVQALDIHHDRFGLDLVLLLVLCRARVPQSLVRTSTCGRVQVWVGVQPGSAFGEHEERLSFKEHGFEA